MTVTPPIRIVVVTGALVATGLVALLFLLGRGAGETDLATPTPPATTPVQQSSPAPTSAKPVPTARPDAAVTRSGYPPVVDKALRKHGVAVIAVYMPGSAVDAFARQEARAAAASAGAGYVAMAATSERAVRALVAKTGVLSSPAVVIVRRPGVVSAVLGISDRELVAQAIAQARP